MTTRLLPKWLDTTGYELGKVLIANGLNGTIVSDITVHEHTNFDLLEAYTQTEEDLSNAVSNTHNHDNMIHLDSYTQSQSTLISSITSKKISAGYGLGGGGDISEDRIIYLGLRYITPQDFGAVGDGWTDDTEAFNNAIATCQTGFILYIPNGNYKLKALNPINFAITILADKKAILFFAPVLETDILFDISHPTGTLSDIILEGLTVRPYPSVVEGKIYFGTVFKIQNTARLTLSRITISNNPVEDIIYKFNSCFILCNTYQTFIENCHTEDCNFNHLECIERTSELHINHSTFSACMPAYADAINEEYKLKVPYIENGCGIKITGNATGVYIVDTTIYYCLQGLYLDSVHDLFATQLIVDACGAKNTYIVNCNGIRFENSWFQATNYYWNPHPVIFIIDSTQIHIISSYIYDGTFDGCVISNSNNINLHNNVISRHGQQQLPDTPNPGETFITDPYSGVVIHNSNTVKIDNCMFTETTRHTGQTLRNKHGIKFVGRLQDVSPFDSSYLPADPYIESKNIIITNNYFDPYLDTPEPVIYFCNNTYTNTLINTTQLNIQIKNNYGDRVLSETGLIFSIKKTDVSEVKYKLEPLYNVDKQLFLPLDVSLYYTLYEKDFSTIGVCKDGNKYVFAGGGSQYILGTVLKANIIQPITANLFCKIYTGVYSDIVNSDMGYKIVLDFYNKDDVPLTILDIEQLLINDYTVGTELKVLIDGIFV